MRSDSEQTTDRASPQAQRLPVNPRRHKVAPEQRKRVIRACNACNIRRVKCSGHQPCHRCSKVPRECEYAAPESTRNALLDENERLRRRCAELEKGQLTAVQNGKTTPTEHHGLQSTVQSGEPPFSPIAALSGAEDTAGRHLRDHDGTTRFLGETSGATFLDHLKKFMFTLVPLTFVPGSGDGSSFVASVDGYQTFDSRPLPNPSVDPLWLPDTQEMVSMLAELRHLIQDGDDDIISGGIIWWGDMSNPPVPTATSISLSTMTTEDTHRPLAFYHVCFALASSIYHVSFRHSEQHTGEAYFKRARLLLGNPLDTVRFTLSDVPVLTLMGFYLIELNRRDAAYMTIHDEASTRTFWSLYILDRWLSVLMGRPPTLADEAIRLPLPSDVATMPPCAGIRANIELARISGYIVCETFKIAPRDQNARSSTQNIDGTLNMLENWRVQLPPGMDLDSTEPSCIVLHMQHGQFIVLTTRPTYLAAVKQAVAARFHGLDWSVEQHPQSAHIVACSQAAVRNVVLAQRLHKKRKFLQGALHFLFNATVILLLSRITSSAAPQKSVMEGLKVAEPGGDRLHESEIAFAIEVFEQESKTGTHYPKDCCQVLHDLKALVDGYLSRNSALVYHGDEMACDHAPSSAEENTSHIAAMRSPQMSWPGANNLYQNLAVWKQSDGLHVRESMLM